MFLFEGRRLHSSTYYLCSINYIENSMEALEWGLFAAGKKAEKTQSDKSDKSAVKSGKVKSALIDSSVN